MYDWSKVATARTADCLPELEPFCNVYMYCVAICNIYFQAILKSLLQPLDFCCTIISHHTLTVFYLLFKERDRKIYPTQLQRRLNKDDSIPSPKSSTSATPQEDVPKPYCSACGKHFATKPSLQRHMRHHKGDYDYR